MFLAINEAENIEIYDRVFVTCASRMHMNSHSVPICIFLFTLFGMNTILWCAWVFHSLSKRSSQSIVVFTGKTLIEIPARNLKLQTTQQCAVKCKNTNANTEISAQNARIRFCVLIHCRWPCMIGTDCCRRLSEYIYYSAKIQWLYEMKYRNIRTIVVVI